MYLNIYEIKTDNQYEENRMNKSKEEIFFPLYHGTSSIFLDSIIKSGLGGENIVKKFHIKDMFSQIVHAFMNQYKDSEWWKKEGFICEKMVNQEVTSSGFNFRHGGVYLTPSFDTAKRYATSNKYGSELISYFILAYEELSRYNQELANIIYPKDHPLRKLLNIEGKPIVIEILEIQSENLVTEQGDSIQEQLCLMQQYPQEMWQQNNFESTKTINSSNIKIINLSN